MVDFNQSFVRVSDTVLPRPRRSARAFLSEGTALYLTNLVNFTIGSGYHANLSQSTRDVFSRLIIWATTPLIGGWAVPKGTRPMVSAGSAIHVEQPLFLTPFQGDKQVVSDLFSGGG